MIFLAACGVGGVETRGPSEYLTETAEWKIDIDVGRLMFVALENC